MVTKDLGMVTAYAYAVAGGYTGTEAQFEQLMADLAVVVDDFDNFSVNVTTLPAGSSATASYADGVLSLGIPKGDKGDKGNTGDTGAPAGFGTVSATVDANIGTPSVEVTASGADTAKNFAFAFHNLKGQKGDKGDTGEVSEAELAEALEDFSANGTVANAEQLTTDIRANDQTPYLFRTAGGSVDIGDREYINGIVGGTIAWNQIVRNGNFADTSGWQISSGVGTPTVENGVITFTQKSSYSMAGLGQSKANTVNRIQPSHIYLFSCDAMAHNEDIKIGIGLPYTNKEKICPSNVFTKLYSIISAPAQVASDTNYQVLQVGNHDASNREYTISVKNFNCFDLTQMFGSTIANYIYALEAANEGAGISWFRKHFPKPYYEYNTGELMSVKALRHKTVGFNAWDEVTELGGLGVTGQPTASTTKIRGKNYIPVLPNTTYYAYVGSGNRIYIASYDADKNFIRYIPSVEGIIRGTFTTPSDARYIRLDIATAYGTTYNHDICINLSWDGERDGEYEEYVEHVYELDPDLELRGIPKLSAGNDLYYDGDVYEPDGTVTRKYGTYTFTGSETLDAVYTRTNGDKYGVIALPNAGVENGMGRSSNGIPFVHGDDAYSGSGTYFSLRSASKITVSVAGATSGADITAWLTTNKPTIVYELATPTTETADPYTNPQIVDDFGTEEFVISNTIDVPIPVGNNTDYPINLKAKLEMAPNSPSQGNGDYIVRQTNGMNEYVPLVIEDALPTIPSTAGTYKLTVTVAEGSDPVLSWEAE